MINSVSSRSNALYQWATDLMIVIDHIFRGETVKNREIDDCEANCFLPNTIWKTGSCRNRLADESAE